MLTAVRPDIDNIACANDAHGQYVMEDAAAGVKVIVLEKPPVIWPGYTEGREADAGTRKRESMDYLTTVLNAVRKGGSKLLYAENFVYVDGMKGLVELLFQAMKIGKGKVLYQWGVCAHQGSHALAYDTPSQSGGGALFNKACHPLGPILYTKQVEGILRGGRPIRPLKVSAVALQVLKHQPRTSGEYFRVMQNVDDFGRITVVFEDQTVAEVVGSDLNISGIWNELSITTDCGQYDIRVNPNNANQLFLPSAEAAGNLLFREKLPTPQGTSFPMPRQVNAHGYVNEMNDAVECALHADRYPQSGALMAWDTMAVLMAAYESNEKGSVFIDVSEYITGRAFEEREGPSPDQFGTVFQTRSP
jgi:predicted dehydrogenase